MLFKNRITVYIKKRENISFKIGKLDSGFEITQNNCRIWNKPPNLESPQRSQYKRKASKVDDGSFVSIFQTFRLFLYKE